MRKAALIFVVTSSFTLGCGGGNQPPKTEDTAASATAPDAAVEDGSSTSPSPEPAASAAAEPSAPAASNEGKAGKETSGDIKPPSGDDPWMASHQMSQADVLKTMRPKQAKVQACFKAAKKHDPTVSGEVKVRFVITNAGKVRDWKDDGSSISDSGVTKCVGDMITKLKFPKQKSPGDAWGAYSVDFAKH